jgi:hypothetical protein
MKLSPLLALLLFLGHLTSINKNISQRVSTICRQNSSLPFHRKQGLLKGCLIFHVRTGMQKCCDWKEGLPVVSWGRKAE